MSPHAEPLSCPADCEMCAADREMEAHYDTCLTCQGDGFPCPVMAEISERRSAAYGRGCPDEQG